MHCCQWQKIPPQPPPTLPSICSGSQCLTRDGRGLISKDSLVSRPRLPQQTCQTGLPPENLVIHTKNREWGDEMGYRGCGCKHRWWENLIWCWKIAFFFPFPFRNLLPHWQESMRLSRRSADKQQWRSKEEYTEMVMEEVLCGENSGVHGPVRWAKSWWQWRRSAVSGWITTVFPSVTALWNIGWHC